MYKSLLISFMVTLLAACGGGGGSSSTSGFTSAGSVNLDCSDTGSITVSDELDVDAKEYVLCLHNKFRSEVALGSVTGDSATNLPEAEDMQALSWDAQLETVAQNWADNCTEASNPDPTTAYLNLSGNPAITDVGENYGSLGSASDPMVIGNVEILFQAWADEVINWTYGTYSGTAVCSSGTCDDATQLFWADTRYVGCAVASCDFNGSDGETDIFLVCNYGNGGNKTGEYPYIEALTTDDICSDDRGGEQLKCTDGLTHSSTYSDGI